MAKKANVYLNVMSSVHPQCFHSCAFFRNALTVNLWANLDWNVSHNKLNSLKWPISNWFVLLQMQQELNGYLFVPNKNNPNNKMETVNETISKNLKLHVTWGSIPFCQFHSIPFGQLQVHIKFINSKFVNSNSIFYLLVFTMSG